MSLLFLPSESNLSPNELLHTMRRPLERATYALDIRITASATGWRSDLNSGLFTRAIPLMVAFSAWPAGQVLRGGPCLPQVPSGICYCLIINLLASDQPSTPPQRITPSTTIARYPPPPPSSIPLPRSPSQ